MSAATLSAAEAPTAEAPTADAQRCGRSLARAVEAQRCGRSLGFTVLAGAFAVGGISGGAFNPAVGTGPILVDALLGDGGFGNLWYYWVGPIVGATLAVPVFKMQLASQE